MLPSSRRLTSAEVPLILKNGKGASFSVVRVKYTPRQGKASTSRFAVVISKKVLKRAADRNRLRRRIYEAVRTIVLPYPIDAVILLSVGTLPWGELEQSVREAFSKVR